MKDEVALVFLERLSQGVVSNDKRKDYLSSSQGAEIIQCHVLSAIDGHAISKTHGMFLQLSNDSLSDWLMD